MTQCPTCKLSMESHSNIEIIECCMKQVDSEISQTPHGICPSCKHGLEDHLDKELAECTIAYLKSGSTDNE